MALGTRTYARPYLRGGGLPSGVKLLLIINIVVFLAQSFGGEPFLSYYFALRPVSLFTMFAVWQVATYMFLHGGISHILFNMLALWMFGKDLEEAWGTQRFLRYYFFCGIGAGVCIVLANYLLPWGNPLGMTLGASGAIYGILLASAVLWPTRIVYINFLFPVQMKYFVLIYGAIAFLGTFQVTSGVSNIAHLGGLLCGWIYLKTPAMQKIGQSQSGMKPWEAIQHRYKQWKLERNKKRFQVYLRKHGSDRGPWTN
ncbi:MAG: rhomboid family intramembrane serine protease [Acidobacteriota bacterium]